MFRKIPDAPKVGTKFGKWVFICEVKPRIMPNGIRRRRALVECDCGTQATREIYDLNNGRSTNCGCVIVERQSKIVDGVASKDHPFYSKWKSMRDRCRNPKCQDYPDYG